MHRERKLAALRRSIGDGWGKGDEVSFFCPLPEPEGCGGKHHKQKLSVNLATDKWHCWVCGQGGRNILKLLAFGGRAHPDYVDYAAEVEKPKEADPEKQYEKVRLPSEFRPLCVPYHSPYYSQAITYLTDRGITADDILTYKLGYCETGRYAERIIIPSFDEYGELNFFVGRAIWKRIGLPYLSGKFDKDIIFNDLLVDWSKPITLVEGPFDALKAGTNSIPLQGKYLSDKLVAKILHKQSAVCIALDCDAVSESMKLAQSLSQLDVDVSILDWPKELGPDADPGSVSKEQFDVLRSAAKKMHNAIDFARFRIHHSSSLEHS